MSGFHRRARCVSAFGAAAVCALVAGLASGAPAQASPHAATGARAAAPPVSVTSAAAGVGGASPGASTQQVVVTGAYGSSTATLDTYQYVGGGWQHVLSTRAEVGLRGLSDTHTEGDGTTPTGTYSFGTTMFGLSTAAPSTRYGYHHIVCGDSWDSTSTSPTYNRFVRVPCTTAHTATSDEELWNETVAYQHFAVVDFNTDPTVPGRGSGIFLHDFTKSGVTAGCVAIAPPALETVLGWLDPAQHPIIRIGTPAEVSAPTATSATSAADLSAVLTAHTGSGSVEVHTLSAASGFSAFAMHAATLLGPVDPTRWQFFLADYDGDGVPDLWAIDTQGASGHTDVHILSGASGFRTWLLQAPSSLPRTSLLRWTFGAADANGDGRADLYAIDSQDPGSRSTAVFAWNGHNLGQLLLARRTALGRLDLSGNTLLVGDANRDGVADLWDVRSVGTASGHTEVHVVDGSDPSRYLVHAATALGTVSRASWSFVLADTGAGQIDIDAVDTGGATSPRVAIQVLTGPGFAALGAEGASPLTVGTATGAEFAAG